RGVAEAPVRHRREGPRLRALRPGVVRLPDETPRGAPVQPDILRTVADLQVVGGPMTVAILGVGVMGETLLSGLIRGGRPVEELLVGEKRAERADQLVEKYG